LPRRFASQDEELSGIIPCVNKQVEVWFICQVFVKVNFPVGLLKLASLFL